MVFNEFSLSKMPLFVPFNFAVVPHLNGCPEVHVCKMVHIKFQKAKSSFKVQLSKPKKMHVIEY